MINFLENGLPLKQGLSEALGQKGEDCLVLTEFLAFFNHIISMFR